MISHLRRYGDEAVSLRFGLWNEGLSLKAMGCLYLLLSLSRLDRWVFSVEGLVALAKARGMGDGRQSFRTALAELEERRFLVRQRQRLANGKLHATHWYVHDRPIPELEDETPSQPVLSPPPEPVPSAGLASTPPETLEPMDHKTAVGKTCCGEPASENRLQQSSLIENIEETPLKEEIKISSLPPAGGTDFQPDLVSPLSPGERRVAVLAAKRKHFGAEVLTLWNQHAPAHWTRIRSIGDLRQRRLNGLLSEYNQSVSQALEALAQSLEQAHQEDWCMKPQAELTLENWLSNGKVRQYQERRQAHLAPSAEALSGSQRDIAELVAANPDLFCGVSRQDGLLLVRYSELVQRLAGYPPSGQVASLQAMAADLAFLRSKLGEARSPLLA